MENNHLTYFKIENFKKFDSLEVKDIGQFNLIVGNNNVGKTCLLEAMSLYGKYNDYTISLENLFKKSNKYKEIISSLYHILNQRKDDNYYYKLKQNTNNFNITNPHLIIDDISNFENNILSPFLRENEDCIKIKFNNLTLKLENKFFEYNEDSKNLIENKYIKDFVEKSNLFSYREINSKSRNWIFISTKESNEKDFSLKYMIDITSIFYPAFLTEKNSHNIIYFSNSINEDNVLRYETFTGNYDVKQDIIKTLNDLFNLNVLDFSFGRNELQIVTNENKDPHSIKKYGEGIQRLILIYLEILCNKDGILFIDEIEIGLHHSKMIEVWNTVFKLARKYNIQLFATTHSKECIEAYCLAIEELDLQQNGKVILLQEEKERIVSYTFQTENLDLSFDYRG